MEETNALLSRLVQTKSVERVLAPIASKLSQLIILNEEYESGGRASFPCDFRWSTSVLRATETFVQVARRLGQNASDEELRREMPVACDALSVTAQNLVTAQQRVVVERCSAGSRKNLIRVAKDILEGTIKIFLLTDDAEVRSVLRSISWVNERLGVLTAVRSMKNLVPSFKTFVESLMLLIKLLNKRQCELVHPRQREGLLSHMATLRRLIPMLSSALQTYAKYPDNQQAKASRDYVVGSVLDCLRDIQELVRNPHTHHHDYGDAEEEDEYPGHFISTIDKIVDSLADGSRDGVVEEVGCDLDLLIETAVRHSMAVAHLSTAHHRSLIITNSQRVMHQRSIVSEVGKNHQENPAYEELGDDFNAACDLLEKEVADLERHVNAAILQLVVTSFSETFQPMERLVKAALKNIVNRESMLEGESEDLLQPYIAAFHAHSDRVCQVARFLAASSPETRRVRVLRSCIELLEKLDPELVPATITSRSDINNRPAVEHLRLLRCEWTSTLSTLVATVDDVIEAADFLEVSELELRETVNQCKGSLYSEATSIAEVTRQIIGITSRVIQVSKAAVEKSDNAIYRNGVMVYIKQLSKVIPAVKTSANRVLNDMGELRLHETLHRRADTVMAGVTKLRAALSGHGHAHLMSPARTTARTADHLKGFEEALAACEEETDHVMETSRDNSTVLEVDRSAATSVKTYITELPGSDLTAVQRHLVAASVRHDEGHVAALCNDVLVRTNHATELAGSVAPHTPEHRETLTECRLRLSQLAPRLLDLAQKSSSGDIDQVEPLHQTAETWAGTLTYLERLLDGILKKWVAVSQKVVDASAVGNTPLLTTQLLADHVRQLAGLRELLADKPEVHSVVTAERLTALQGAMDEFESQTTMLITVADMLSNTNHEEEKAQLERTGREWAALAFTIAAMIDRLAEEALQQVRGGDIVSPDWDNSAQVNDVIRRFREDTVRVKDAVGKVSQWMESAELRDKITTQLDAIDLVVSEMAASCEPITEGRSPLQTPERLYAPLRITLHQWQWAVKVQEMWLTIDDVTIEYSLQMEHLLVRGPDSMIEGSDTLRSPEAVSPGAVVSVSDLRARVTSTIAKVTEALTPLRDPVQRAAVQRDLTDLSTLTDSLVTTVESHIDTPTDKSQSEVKLLGRSWACKAHNLMYSLSDISAVESSVVREATSLLKGPGQFACSTPGDTTATRTPTSRPPRDRPLRDLSNTLARTTSEKPNTSILSTATEKDETLTKLDKTPSGRKVTFDSWAYGERETQTVSTYITDSDPSPTTSQLPSSEKPTTYKKTMSYKELAAAPRAQHRQPEAPSAKFGLRLPVHAKSRSFDLDGNNWEDNNNAIVRVAKEMTQHLNYMATFSRDHTDGMPRSKVKLITAAKEVAKNGEALVKFAKILAKYCIDSRLAADLTFYADHVPMVATQLNMLASVKAASPDDTTTEKMLVQNAEKLLSAISKMLTAAEAACVKGLRQPPSDALDESEAVVLATQWRHRFTRHRRIEKSNMSMDELGLRRVSQPSPGPTLTELVSRKS